MAQLKLAPPLGAATPPADGELEGALTLPTDRQTKKRLEAAQDDYIKHEAWKEAASLLQSVLNSKEDVFVPIKRKGADNQEKTHLVSARKEANRLIGTMPANGLEFYESLYGTQAKDLLSEAKKKGDIQMLADVAFRFFHTQAGAEATDLLGTYHLDRGDALAAALCYERLLAREGTDRLQALTLLKAALAFRLTLDRSYEPLAEKAWKRLSTKVGPEGLRVDDETIGLPKLQAEISRSSPLGPGPSPFDWDMFRGNASRSGKARGTAPFLESEWQRSMVEGLEPQARSWLEQRLQPPHRGDPILPAFSPIATGNKLIYRNYKAVYAVDIRTGKLIWYSTEATAGLDKMIRTPDAGQFSAGAGSILFENSTIGTLSTDNRRVYWIDDLPLPPIMGMNAQWVPGLPMNGQLPGSAQRNRLVALDLDSEGKIIWERGDPEHDKTELKESYFLGAPLPLAGKLYVLTEKNAELRLVCLDAAKGEPIWTQMLATAQDRLSNDVSRRIQAVHLAYGEGILVCPTNAGAVVGVDLLSRSLAWAFRYREKPREPAILMGVGGRFGGRGMRVQGIQAWAPDGTGFAKMGSDWKMSAPIIEEGKVVFTAPDGGAIHCLNLRDGNPLWQAERRDDLYLAGVFSGKHPAVSGAGIPAGVSDGKVVLVGKNTCRAISLADGKKELWQVETGLPSGMGAACGNHYYLPLKKGEVCKIDLDKGVVEAHSPSLKNEVLGNLLFYDGQMISQNESVVTCYPQLDAKEAQISRVLNANPKDPLALTERGELRLYQGNLSGAVADLRDAMKNNPPAGMVPKTRAKLYTTLTELLQQNFNAAEQYLEEYKDLCKVTIPPGAPVEEKQKLDEEQRRRQANFLSLLARGRENQGRVIEAFHAYVDFAGLAAAKELVTVINEPAVQALPTVWARGRIADLVTASSPRDRRVLEEEVLKLLHAIEAKQKTEPTAVATDELRRFVDMFGSLFPVGRAARLRLAEQLAEGDNYIEAELQLRELIASPHSGPAARVDRDAEASGAEAQQSIARATEALARLMTRKGALEEAADNYCKLRDSFSNVVVRDGKTGADLFSEIAADKRFLPYLEAREPPPPDGVLRASEIPEGMRIPQQYRLFEPRGELPPFFQHHTLAWTEVAVNGTSAFHLKLLDKETNEERWSLAGSPMYARYDYQNMNSVRFPFYTKGHLTVLILGHVVYGLDLMEKKKLWEKDLLAAERLGGQERVNPQLGADVRYLSLDVEGRLYLSNHRNLQEIIGQIGAVTTSYVCLRTRDGLVALDPLTGGILWTKSDISPQTQIFGDDQCVYVVELRDDRSVASTRAVRGRDGANVDVPDFSASFQHRQRILGGRLLVSETDSHGSMILRLYDVRLGADVWKKTLPPNAVLLQGDEPELVGIVEQDGNVTAVDLTTRQEIFRAAVLPEHLDKVNEGLFLRDSRQCYVVLNRQPEQNANRPASTSNFYALRAAEVNGVVYAFDRDSGALNWHAQVPHKESQVPCQMILLEEFKHLPMMIFSVRHNKPANLPGRVQFTPIVATLSIDKQTGKRVWDTQNVGGYPPHPQGQYFLLQIDRRAGTIDLVSNHTRLRHYVDSGPTKADAK
jgi:outer membrane protein assembly factor BamB